MNDPKGQRTLAKALAGKNLPTGKVREAVKMFRDGFPMDQVIESINSQKNSSEGSNRRARNRKFSRLLDKSVLTLRICMVRLDSIIEEIESGDDTDNLKHLLIQKRIAHTQPD